MLNLYTEDITWYSGSDIPEYFLFSERNIRYHLNQITNSAFTESDFWLLQLATEVKYNPRVMASEQARKAKKVVVTKLKLLTYMWPRIFGRSLSSHPARTAGWRLNRIHWIHSYRYKCQILGSWRELSKKAINGLYLTFKFWRVYLIISTLKIGIRPQHDLSDRLHEILVLLGEVHKTYYNMLRVSARQSTERWES